MRFISLSLLTMLSSVVLAGPAAGSGADHAPASCLIGEPVVCVPFAEGATIARACKTAIEVGILTEQQAACERDVSRAIAPMNPAKIPQGHHVPIPISLERAWSLQKSGQWPATLKRFDTALATSLQESQQRTPQQAPSFPEQRPANPAAEKKAEDGPEKLGLTGPPSSLSIVCAGDTYEIVDGTGSVRPTATNQLTTCITEQRERLDTLRTRVDMLEEKEGELTAALSTEQKEGDGIIKEAAEQVDTKTWRGIAISAMVIAALMAAGELGRTLYRYWQSRHPTEKPVMIPESVMYHKRAFPDAHIDVPAILRTTWFMQPPCGEGWLAREQIATHLERCKICQEYLQDPPPQQRT